jgi:hypothetical protein
MDMSKFSLIIPSSFMVGDRPNFSEIAFIVSQSNPIVFIEKRALGRPNATLG